MLPAEPSLSPQQLLRSSPTTAVPQAQYVLRKHTGLNIYLQYTVIVLFASRGVNSRLVQLAREGACMSYSLAKLHPGGFDPDRSAIWRLK